jgi:hypothetical protein
MALLALAALLYTPQSPSACHANYDPKVFPVAAVRQLAKAGIYGGVFTEDLWGGYLIYCEYPRGRVFIDGRSDFYGAEFSRRYIQTMGAQAGWEPYLAGYGVETVLLRPDAALAGALRQSRAWHLIYDDGVALIFRPLGAASLAFETVSASQPGGGNQLPAIDPKGKQLDGERPFRGTARAAARRLSQSIRSGLSHGRT